MKTMNFEARKEYRNLDDKYKTPKFLQLYTKMYEYMLSISKNKIVLKQSLKYFCLYYIHCFLKAKNFYHWRERIYTLLTQKNLCNTIKQYELLYGIQNAKIHFNEIRNKVTQTNLERYDCENAMQNVKVKQKGIQTNLERYGCKNPMQCKEVRQKVIRTNLERYGCENPYQAEEVKEKIENTLYERYGVRSVAGISRGTKSSIADEFCINLYTKLSDDIKPYCIFFKKSNKEYMLEMTGKKYYYDFTILTKKIKLIIEFDGVYWHGLMEGQKFVKCHNKEVPVEEIWEMDKEKQKLAEMNGFKMIRVREDEYMVDKEKTLERVLEIVCKSSI